MAAYLDHAATTPLRPGVLEAMLPFLTDRFGNPSGSHTPARRAQQALDEAREVVAAGLGCLPGEVVFTSGGTEADNLAVLGVRAGRPGPVVCTAADHHAVLEPTRSVGGRVVPVDRSGRVDLEALDSALDPSVSVVSVILANNEVGVVQLLDEVAALVRDRAPGAALHTDAVHGVCWLDVARLAAPCDLVSVSGHKFGGPKGIGVLVVRSGTPFGPLLLGGSQERGRRPGTQDVAGAAGLAAALAATVASRSDEVARVGFLRDRLQAGLASLDGVRLTVPPGTADKVAGTCHVLVPGLDSEELLLLLDESGVSASAGSACASGALEPSHVLLSMGIPPAEARSAVRFSLGWSTTGDEIDTALAVMAGVLSQLRR